MEIENGYLLSEKTGKILKAFYDVYNELGYGFLESVYKNALYLDLSKQGLDCVMERGLTVFYKGSSVGTFFADIVVDNSVIIEVKAAKTLVPQHEAQLVNYLRATEIEVGLLLNFGPEPQQRRIIFTNDRKKSQKIIPTPKSNPYNNKKI